MATIAEMLIRLGMDSSGLKQGANQAKAEISSLEKSFKGLEQAGKTMSSIGKSLTMGVTMPLVGVGAALGKFTADAAAMVKVRDAFDGIAEAAGSSGDAVLLAMQKGSQGMLSNIDIMKNFNLASQLVSEDFAMKLPEAFGYLGKVSAATGESMDYMLNSLIKGVGRLSPLILDNLGIQVDMNAAYEAYGATLGKSVEEMTKAEKQTAVMNATMTALAENTAAMPDNFGSVTASLKATFQNAKDAIGETLIPVLGTVTGALTGAIDKIVEMTTEGGNLYPVIQDLGESFGKIVGKIANFIDKIGELDPAWVKVISDIVLFLATAGPVLIVLGKITSLVGTVGSGLLTMGTAMAGTAVGGAALVGPLALVAAGIIAIGVAILKHRADVDQYADSIAKARGEAVASGQSYESFAKTIGDVGHTVDDANFKLTMHQGSLKDVKSALTQLGDAGIITEKELGYWYNSVSNGNETVNAAQEAVYGFVERQRDLEYATDQSAESLIEQSIAHAQLAHDLGITAGELDNVTMSVQEMWAAQSKVGSQIEYVTGNLGTYNSLMAEITAKEKEYNEMPHWKQSTKEGQELLGTINNLKGGYESLVAQINANNLLEAILGNGEATEAEFQTYLDYLVKTGLATKEVTEQMMADWKETEQFKDSLNWDVNGNVSITDKEALERIRLLKLSLAGIERNVDVTISVNQMGTLAGVHPTVELRALGGETLAGTPYIVGERGAELFVPKMDGQIIPNNKLTELMRNSGGATETANANSYTPTQQDTDDLSTAFLMEQVLTTLRNMPDSIGRAVRDNILLAG